MIKPIFIKIKSPIIHLLKKCTFSRGLWREVCRWDITYINIATSHTIGANTPKKMAPFSFLACDQFCVRWRQSRKFSSLIDHKWQIAWLAKLRVKKHCISNHAWCATLTKTTVLLSSNHKGSVRMAPLDEKSSRRVITIEYLGKTTHTTITPTFYCATAIWLFSSVSKFTT